MKTERVVDMSTTVVVVGVMRIVGTEDVEETADKVAMAGAAVVEGYAMLGKKEIAVGEDHAGFLMLRIDVGIVIVLVAEADIVCAIISKVADARGELLADFLMEKIVAVVVEETESTGGREMIVSVLMVEAEIRIEIMAMEEPPLRKMAFGRMVYFTKEVLEVHLAHGLGLVLVLVLPPTNVHILLPLLKGEEHLFLKGSVDPVRVTENRKPSVKMFLVTMAKVAALNKSYKITEV